MTFAHSAEVVALRKMVEEPDEKIEQLEQENARLREQRDEARDCACEVRDEAGWQGHFPWEAGSLQPEKAKG